VTELQFDAENGCHFYYDEHGKRWNVWAADTAVLSEVMPVAELMQKAAEARSK
jgi:hypothetical protein